MFKVLISALGCLKQNNVAHSPVQKSSSEVVLNPERSDPKSRPRNPEVPESRTPAERLICRTRPFIRLSCLKPPHPSAVGAACVLGDVPDSGTSCNIDQWRWRSYCGSKKSKYILKYGYNRLLWCEKLNLSRLSWHILYNSTKTKIIWGRNYRQKVDYTHMHQKLCVD